MTFAIDDETSLEDRVEIFKALADPIRLDLLTRIASSDEVACTTLVEEAHVTASTISYHMKGLKAAGLVAVRKEGRNYHYTLRQSTLSALSAYLENFSR